jgi:hypothetical protein
MLSKSIFGFSGEQMEIDALDDYREVLLLIAQAEEDRGFLHSMGKGPEHNIGGSGKVVLLNAIADGIKEIMDGRKPEASKLPAQTSQRTDKVFHQSDADA